MITDSETTAVLRRIVAIMSRLSTKGGCSVEASGDFAWEWFAVHIACIAGRKLCLER